MDSRSRSLHPLWTELRGHGKGSGAGNGKPGASEVVLGLENPAPIKDEGVMRSEIK